MGPRLCLIHTSGSWDSLSLCPNLVWPLLVTEGKLRHEGVMIQSWGVRPGARVSGGPAPGSSPPGHRCGRCCGFHSPSLAVHQRVSSRKRCTHKAALWLWTQRRWGGRELQARACVLPGVGKALGLLFLKHFFPTSMSGPLDPGAGSCEPGEAPGWLCWLCRPGRPCSS